MIHIKKNILFFFFRNLIINKKIKLIPINYTYKNINNSFLLKYYNFYYINIINKFLFVYFLKNSLIKKNYKILTKKNKKLFSPYLNKKIKIIKFSTPVFIEKNKFDKLNINYYLINLYLNENYKCKFNLIFKKNQESFINSYHFKKYLNLFYNLCYIKINFFKLNTKKINFNKLQFIKYFVNINDKYNLNLLENNINFFSSRYLIKYINFYDNEFRPTSKNKNWNIYNNYYPVIKPDYLIYNEFFNKFKFNRNINHILFTNKVVIKFLEIFLKKRIYIKIISNSFYKIKNRYFNILINEYKNFKPVYWKKNLVTDFIEILWYSFLLKDLKMLSNWISNFMESLNFKNHKKFISFFNNFINKYSSMFIDILGVRGFFFDIRGKVGVTGSSKKRHLCFKFGSIKKSSKKNKICFNQNLVRTYSGVMGLTYIISY